MSCLRRGSQLEDADARVCAPYYFEIITIDGWVTSDRPIVRSNWLLLSSAALGASVRWALSKVITMQSADYQPYLLRVKVDSEMGEWFDGTVSGRRPLVPLLSVSPLNSCRSKYLLRNPKKKWRNIFQYYLLQVQRNPKGFNLNRVGYVCGYLA